jgi:subtilisin family serine protease
MDQESLPLDNTYSYEYTGKGVNVFIVDSGIRSTHVELDGRVECGFKPLDVESCQDSAGHGTHVAATVGGTVCSCCRLLLLFRNHGQCWL